MHEPQPEALARLRVALAAIEARECAADVLPFGIGCLDAKLAHGGLSSAALHEIAPASPQLAELGAATLFTAGVGARFAAENGSVLWAVSRFDLYSPGLEQAGLRPNQLLFVECRRDEDVLAVMEDGLHHGGLAAVVGEVRRANLTVTRRLQLAAGDGKTPALLFRHWRKRDLCPLAEPSAAETRWRIGCAPSPPLDIPGVGRPRWSVELARQRGGNPFTIILEACDNAGRVHLPAGLGRRADQQTGTEARAA